jgi:hypothetical protein
MFASAEFVLHLAVSPIPATDGVPGAICRIGCQRATGPVFSSRADSIANPGAVLEARHSY